MWVRKLSTESCTVASVVEEVSIQLYASSGTDKVDNLWTLPYSVERFTKVYDNDMKTTGISKHGSYCVE